MPEYQVFVSHATADKWIAKILCEKLESTGASTFRDDRDIGGGDDIPESIRREIKRSKELVVLLTPESILRPWVMLEVGAAWGRSRTMRVTAILCHVKADLMPAIIKDKKAVTLNEFDDFLQQLSARMTRRRR